MQKLIENAGLVLASCGTLGEMLAKDGAGGPHAVGGIVVADPAWPRRFERFPAVQGGDARHLKINPYDSCTAE